MRGNVNEFFSRFSPKVLFYPISSQLQLSYDKQKYWESNWKFYLKKKGTSRHQCPKKVLSPDNQLQRGLECLGMLGHISWCSTQPKHSEDTVHTLSSGQALDSSNIFEQWATSETPCKTCCWKTGGWQRERGGTSKPLGGSEKHLPHFFSALTGLSRAHALLEYIFLKSFASDNAQKPAVNGFCCNRPDNSNCTQPTAHT